MSSVITYELHNYVHFCCHHCHNEWAVDNKEIPFDFTQSIMCIHCGNILKLVSRNEFLKTLAVVNV